MNHNINKLSLTVTILFFCFFLLLDKTFSLNRNSLCSILTTVYLQNFMIYSACIILTSCSLLFPRSGGLPIRDCMSLIVLNFKRGRTFCVWKRNTSLLVFCFCICDFPCRCCSFNPNSIVAISFFLCRCFKAKLPVGIQP